MGDVRCPECKCMEIHECPDITSGHMIYYRCANCKLEFVAPIQKQTRYVVIRDDNNRIMTSEKQAITVAEKLATESPSHTYYVAKLISESKMTAVVTNKLD
jgi:hypothetical protein